LEDVILIEFPRRGIRPRSFVSPVA